MSAAVLPFRNAPLASYATLMAICGADALVVYPIRRLAVLTESTHVLEVDEEMDSKWDVLLTDPHVATVTIAKTEANIANTRMPARKTRDAPPRRARWFARRCWCSN